MQWDGRECKIDAGVLLMSKVDDPDNWDYAPNEPGPDMAVAMGLPGIVVRDQDGHLSELPCNREIVGMLPVDDGRMLLVGSDGTVWCIYSNPADGGRVDFVGMI